MLCCWPAPMVVFMSVYKQSIYLSIGSMDRWMPWWAGERRESTTEERVEKS